MEFFAPVAVWRCRGSASPLYLIAGNIVNKLLRNDDSLPDFEGAA